MVDGWAQPLQIMVALRVKFYNAATGKSRRAVWVQVQEGPKRSQREWQQDPAGLAAEVSRAIDKAAVKLAEKLSIEGGAGEVIASRF